MTTKLIPPDTSRQVYKFIIEGHSSGDILEYLEANKMSLEDAKKTFEGALKRFVKAANLPKSVQKGWCFEAYRDLYRRLLETGDYAGALKAVTAIAKLSDVFPNRNVKDASGDTLKDEIDEYIDSAMALE